MACTPTPTFTPTPHRQDPSGDIARTAQLVNRGLPLIHLLHTPPKGVRPGGCLFVPASDEAAAAEIISGGLLDWLKRAEYDLDTELQACPSSDPNPNADPNPNPNPNHVLAQLKLMPA